MVNGLLTPKRYSNRWVAYSPGGVPIGELDDHELRNLVRDMEDYLRGMLSGSEMTTVFPPRLTFKGVDCTFKRSNVLKMDPVKEEAGIR